MLAALSDNDRPLSIGSFSAVVGIHVLGLWGILAMSQIAPQVIEAAPLYVEFIQPAQPEPIKPPEPEPPQPPRPIEKPVKKQLIATEAKPVPTAIETPPEPAPAEPLPPVQAAAPVAPEAPPAPPKAASSCFRSNYRKPPPIPVYPQRSIQLGEEGTVVVEVLISTTGTVKEAKTVVSSGSRRLDEAAERAARKTEFLPSEFDGNPVEVREKMTYPFNIGGEQAAPPPGGTRRPC